MDKFLIRSDPWPHGGGAMLGGQLNVCVCWVGVGSPPTTSPCNTTVSARTQTHLRVVDVVVVVVVGTRVAYGYSDLAL